MIGNYKLIMLGKCGNVDLISFQSQLFQIKHEIEM